MKISYDENWNYEDQIYFYHKEWGKKEMEMYSWNYVEYCNNTSAS